MPSPTMATVPYFWSFLTTSALSPGSTSDTTFSTPICFATASAVRLLSPVSITVLTPILWSSDIACLLSSFTTSATAIIPASLPSMAKYNGVLPSPASLSPAASIAESRIPFDLSRDALPPIADFPFISALTP